MEIQSTDVITNNTNDSVQNRSLYLQQTVFAHTSREFKVVVWRGAFGLNTSASTLAADLQTTTPFLVKNTEFTSG